MNTAISIKNIAKGTAIAIGFAALAIGEFYALDRFGEQQYASKHTEKNFTGIMLPASGVCYQSEQYLGSATTETYIFEIRGKKGAYSLGDYTRPVLYDVESPKVSDGTFYVSRSFDGPSTSKLANITQAGIDSLRAEARAAVNHGVHRVDCRTKYLR